MMSDISIDVNIDFKIHPEGLFDDSDLITQLCQHFKLKSRL